MAAKQDDICVTGIAGYFPECNSIVELRESLFNKVDLITDDERRWRHTNTEIPKRCGKLKEIEKFDALFFGNNYHQAHRLDPMGRVLLERVYECIIDAGVNPRELRNSNTAVIVGICISEQEKSFLYDRINANDFGIGGCGRSSIPVVISNWLGTCGPSYVVDTACSSSLYALDHAYKMIRNGLCDAAIVGGTNLNLHPCTSLSFAMLGVLSNDGTCKCFDESANGYARSESIVACFLQKAKDSRRVHARVVHAKTNCDGYKEQGITYPAGPMQKLLLSQFYDECGISPTSLEFVEAHGTGTQVGDPEELSAIDEIFCTGRKGPLFIGSIKSSLGHAEPSSGLNSVAKVCIAYNSGFIPPNIHYKIPRQNVPALVEGRIQVVTEKQAWNRGLSSLSSFGFGGANAHILLQNSARDKVNNGLPADNLPRLVCVSGRSEAAVVKILSDLESRPVDADEIRLWHAIHEQDIEGHPFRGFTLLRSNASKTISLAHHVQQVSSTLRPVMFQYLSFGKYWSSLAIRLMKLPIFADAMQKCHAALEAKDFNLFALFNTANNQENQWRKTFGFLGNVAVHIGLTHILKTVGIEPDYLTGSEENELCCAYANGNLTAEETILAAYGICLASEDKQGLLSLKELISKLVEGSKRWLTSSLAQAQRKKNCIVIDIGIDDIQSNCDKLASEDVTSVRLVDRNTEDIYFLFTALGRLYEAGLNPLLAKIYPHIEFPVPQSTPFLSHLVEWNHKENWFVSKYSSVNLISCNERTIQVTLKKEIDEFIAGHTIDGRVIYPATGYLVLVWETLALMTDRLFTEVSVVFEDVYFQRATNMPKDGEVEFTVTLSRGSGCFEVLENDMSVVTGYIYEEKDVGKEYRTIPEAPNTVEDREQKMLSTKDFYKELNLRGYQYKDLFRGVKSCNVEGTRGSLMWRNNWITFLDTVLQVNIVANDTRSLYVPTRIEKVSIDVGLHYKTVSKTASDLKLPKESHESVLEFRAYPHVQTTRAGGVEIRGIHVTAISKKPALGIPVYETNVFIPNYSTDKMMVKDVVRTNIQLILENSQTYKFKTIELVDSEYKANKLQPIIEEVGDVLGDMPLVQAELLVISEEPLKMASNITVANKKLSSESNAMLFIGANLLTRPNVINEAFKTLKNDGFILTRESFRVNPTDFRTGFQIITVLSTESEHLVLIRRKVDLQNVTCIEIITQDNEYSWIDKVKKDIINGKPIVLYSQNEPINGLLGLVNCLRKEPGGENVRGFLIADPTSPKFDPNITFYKNQLDQGLAHNVYKDGQWGTYRHLLLNEIEAKPTDHAFVKQTVVGDLSSLKWLEGSLSDKKMRESGSDLLVHVYYSAMNFRDVMTAMGRVQIESVARGRLAQDCVQGIEVSGKTANGYRVMGICDRGITNLVKIDPSLTWCIPDEWSLAEAATVPVAYATVLMALVMVGKIRRGESILIHAGSGAVGQAAINVALHYGLEVFTTVGTPAKRAFIKRLFPQITDNRIGNSRDTSFEDLIRRETNGKGVNLVLNSLADDKLQASVKCLSQRGRFLEIGKYDIFINTKLETCFLKKEISFHGIMLDFINEDSSTLLRRDIKDLVLKGIVSGAVRPITYCSFEKDEIESAFRYMAAGKHIGKIVIKIRDEEQHSSMAKPSILPIVSVPRYTCSPDYVYVLVGGLGGFGIELADWLVLRGARKLVFSSRRGVSNGYQALRIKIWKSYGTQIQISTHDVATESGCEQMLKNAASLGPVRAIFNLAVILKDAIFQNQTPETFQQSAGPKAQATIYLDKHSRTLCPDLKDFVVFSSVSCGRGNAGQTNYGFSNSVMERVCEERKKLGLPALAIQWGAIGDVGLVADMQEEDKQLEIGGTLQQRISSCMQAMDKFLKQDAPIVSSIVVAEKRSGGYSSGSVVGVVAQIIGIGDLKTVSRQVPLSEMGMDSVMAVEIKQTLERDYEIFLSAQEIRMLSFAKLLQLTSVSQGNQSEVSPTESRDIVNTGGLELIIRNFGNEKTASEPYIFMPTLTSSEAEGHAANNDENILFLLPGLESCAETFKELCSKLQTKACVLQLGINRAQDDMEQITNKIYKTVKQRLAPGANFSLLGYSFGSLPILELAAKLENEGHKGIVFCLDGSPEYSAELAKTFLKTSDDFQLQNNIIAHVYNMLQTETKATNTLMDKLNSINSFEDRIKYAAEMVPNKLEHSLEFLSSIAASVFNRLKILFNYNYRQFRKIASPVVLLRQKAIPDSFTCGENYGLDKFTTGKVTVHLVDGDHATIVDNAKCAEIINQTISDITQNNIPRRANVRRIGGN